MNFIFLVYCIIIFFGFGAAGNYEISTTTGVCKGDFCLNVDNETHKTTTFDLEDSVNIDNYTFTNLTENLSEKEIYFISTQEESLSDSKSNFAQNSQTEITSKKELPVSPESAESKNVIQITEEPFSSTNVTEVSRYSDSEDLISTVEPSVSTATTFTNKLNLPTTKTPLAASNSFLLYNLRKNENICFCDILLNQCDINCCCDEDCTAFHFKVFTKCSDQGVLYDGKYCYNTNFIFGNNTSHKVIETNEGLFCIVKENLKTSVNYKTKAKFTTLEAFNKGLINNMYAFSQKPLMESEFINRNYVAGSVVWTFQNGQLTPLKMAHSSVGILCNSEVNVRYLMDEVKSCFYQQLPKTECGSVKIGEVLHHLRSIHIISNPVSLNKSQSSNSSKICTTTSCVGITPYLCQTVDNTPDCIRITADSKGFSDISCWNSLSRIQYQICHNGSEGIQKMEAYLWVSKFPKVSGEFLTRLITEVKYTWISSTRTVFKRSGNPGYLTGQPILAGRKIHNSVNGTSNKKEAIELSLDPKDWLTVLGSEKGICSSQERIPVNFRENGQFVCSLNLSKSNFSKEECVELQNNIFKLLIGNDVINETRENYFNTFIATFGNSRIEETGDWVQVVIDAFAIISSQAYFKSNYYQLMCKNMITDLYIDIIYSNTGSFLAPQAKILGVSFQFGKHKDLIFYCDTPGCENTTLQSFKLSSSVNFLDVTKPAADAFAEPLSLEVKLPHDFFYPFFSKGVRSRFFNKLILIVIFNVVRFVLHNC